MIANRTLGLQRETQCYEIDSVNSGTFNHIYNYFPYDIFSWFTNDYNHKKEYETLQLTLKNEINQKHNLQTINNNSLSRIRDLETKLKKERNSNQMLQKQIDELTDKTYMNQSLSVCIITIIVFIACIGFVQFRNENCKIKTNIHKLQNVINKFKDENNKLHAQNEQLTKLSEKNKINSDAISLQ